MQHLELLRQLAMVDLLCILNILWQLLSVLEPPKAATLVPGGAMLLSQWHFCPYVTILMASQ